MNKKLMAVAVAGALAAPAAAFAQASNVQMYGLFQTAYESFSATGASNTAAPAGTTHVGFTAGATAVGTNTPQRSRDGSYSSRWGVRGTEDLGNGLSAVFQLESQFQADTPAAAATGGSGTLAMRDTFVGLSSKTWGTVRMGMFDTAYATMSYPLDQWIGYTAALGTSLINNSYLSTSTTGASNWNTANNTQTNALSFQRREGNQFEWASPSWSGLEGRIYHATNEYRGNDVSAPAAGARTANPSLWGARLTYTNGPLYLGYAREQHNDMSVISSLGTGAVIAAAPANGQVGAGGTASSSKDTGDKVVAQYKFGNTQLGVIWDRLNYTNSGGTAAAVISKFQRNAFAVTGNHQIGNFNLRAYYARANDGSCSLATGAACSTQDMGATQWMLGGMYDLSKRTSLFGYYVQTNNKQFAGYSGSPAGGLGSDPRLLALGIKHAF